MRGGAVAAVIAVVGAACTAGGTTTTVASGPAGSAPAVTVAAADLPLPPPPAPMAVVARRVGAAADPQEGERVEVSAYVLSEEAVARVELWAGGEQVDVAGPAEPSTRTTEVLEWSAGAAGLHVLLVRAVDAGGRTGQSFPVWVRVREAAAPPSAAVPASGRVAAAGRMAGGLAAQTGLPAVPPAPAVRAGDGCTTKVEVAPVNAAGVVVYAAALGSGGFSVVDVIGPEGGTLAVPAGPVPMVVYTEAYQGDAAVPSAPVVVPPNACAQGAWSGGLAFDGAFLTPPTAVDRAYLYVTTDDATWNRVPEPDQTFVEPEADGRLDFAGMLPDPGPGGSITVEAWGWKAGALVALGRAGYTAGSVPAGGGPVWSLAPGIPVLPTAGSLDWVLPTVDNSDIQNPVKGEALLRSGLLCTFPPTGGKLAILPTECDNAPSGKLPSTNFRWQPAPGAVTHGIWQVSAVPPPSAPLLFFPGLLGSGPVPKPAGASVDFEIPELPAILAATNPSSAPTGSVGLPDASQLSFQMVVSLAGAAAAPAGGAAASLPAAAGGPTFTFALPPSLGGATTSAAAAPGSESPSGLYVRVIPMDGTQPQAQVSNLVEFALDHTAPPPPPPPAKPGFILTATMQPPRLPNPAYTHCVRVVENPFGSKNPAPVPSMDFAYKTFESNAFKWENGVKVYKGLVPGATVCALEPSPPEDDWWDVIVDAVEFVAWVWDMYADVYGMLKEKIVEGLVFVSGCEALLDEDACGFIATQVVNVGAAMAGLPPSLPKFSELVEAAKGDVEDWLIEAAVQAGYLDCGDDLQSTCEQLAEEMLDELVDKIEAEATKAATAQAQSGGYTLFLNPAITVVPEPAGILSPAVFEVTLIRTPEPTTYSTCSVKASVMGTTTWSWPADDGYHADEQVTAFVMASKTGSVDVAGMAPWQSKKFVLVLDKPHEVFLPGQPPWKGSYLNPEYDPSTWIFFFAPSVLTTSVGSPCTAGTPPGQGASQAWPQDNLPTQPWEIP